MATVQLPRTFRHHSGGGCFTVIVLTFFGPIVGSPLYAGAKALGVAPEVAIPAIAGVALVLAAFVYFTFSTEWVVLVDARGIRVTRQSVVGPLRGKLHVDFETQWDRHQHVYDQMGVQQTKHGTQKGYDLVIGKYCLSSSRLGTAERTGPYLELLAAVRAAVGPKLVERQNLGELGEAVEKLVEQRLAARSGGKREEPREGG